MLFYTTVYSCLDVSNSYLIIKRDSNGLSIRFLKKDEEIPSPSILIFLKSQIFFFSLLLQKKNTRVKSSLNTLKMNVSFVDLNWVWQSHIFCELKNVLKIENFRTKLFFDLHPKPKYLHHARKKVLILMDFLGELVSFWSWSKWVFARVEVSWILVWFFRIFQLFVVRDTTRYVWKKYI